MRVTPPLASAITTHFHYADEGVPSSIFMLTGCCDIVSTPLHQLLASERYAKKAAGIIAAAAYWLSLYNIID